MPTSAGYVVGFGLFGEVKAKVMPCLGVWVTYRKRLLLKELCCRLDYWGRLDRSAKLSQWQYVRRCRDIGI